MRTCQALNSDHHGRLNDSTFKNQALRGFLDALADGFLPTEADPGSTVGFEWLEKKMKDPEPPKTMKNRGY